MAPEVKNNESVDSKIKGMLSDKKLTQSERQGIIEMLNSKKEEAKDQIKSETLTDLKNFLNNSKWSADFEKFKKDMLPKIKERLEVVDKNTSTIIITNARDSSGNNISKKFKVNLDSINKSGLTEEEIKSDIQEEDQKLDEEIIKSMKPDRFNNNKKPKRVIKPEQEKKKQI